MKLLKKTTAIAMILMFLLSSILPVASIALNADVASTEDEEEIEKLLGTTSEKARQENILGMAGNYSVFVEEDFTINAAETGGKAAVGGKLDASGIKNADQNYKYQIGCGEYDYKAGAHNGTADIVVGEGPIYNVDLTQGATISGSKYNMDKTAVVSTDTTQMNWEDFSEEELDNIIQADAIDFDSEFEYLRNLSKELAEKEMTGTISYKKFMADPKNPYEVSSELYDATVFSGENNFFNIFNVTKEQWDSYKDIFLDVPYNSYVIINIDGEMIVCDGKVSSGEAFANRNIFYPMSRIEVVKQENLQESEYAFLTNKNTNRYLTKESGRLNLVTRDVYEFVKDEEGYSKTFVNLLSNRENHWDKGQYLLFNLPNATSFELKGNWVGSILAPKANGSDAGQQITFRYGNTWCNGHLAGNLICKSYNGYQEFGTTLFSMPKSYLELKEVKINKVNSKNNEMVAGATMQIKALDGTVIYQWETTEQTETVKLAEGQYILNEVDSPNGYSTAEPIAFEVRTDGTVKTLQKKYEEAESVANILNETMETYSASQYLNEAVRSNKKINKITYEADTTNATTRTQFLLDTLIYGSRGTRTGYDIQPLRYTSNVENEIIECYIPFLKNYWNMKFYRGNGDGTAGTVNDVLVKNFTIYHDEVVEKEITAEALTNATVSGNTLTFGNTPETGIKVTIKKVDKESKTSLAGVGFGIYAEEANDMFEKDELVVGGVTDVNGELTLERYAIPEGKYYLKEISVPTGYIISDEKTDVSIGNEIIEKEITVENDYTKVEITKSDITTSEPVLGAKLHIENEAGETVGEEWTTTEEAHRIDKLPTGKYKLVETQAPDGYVIAEAVEFEVEATGEIQKVDMEDDYTKVEITKSDITTSEPVVGATLHIENEEGETVGEEWTTTEEAHRIDRLPAGKYKLVETQAPDGYVVAESIEFEVEATGEIQKVEMEDDYTKVEITKSDITTSEPVIGAKLHIENEAGETVGEEWTTTEEAHRIDRLPAGKYKLVETQAPDGYVIAEAVEFEVEATGEIQKVEMEDDYTKVEITKSDITTSEPVIGAKLHIENEAGETVGEEWTTTEEAYRIDKLPVGKYKLVETQAPDGYVVAEAVEFEVEATGEIQKVDMKDAREEKADSANKEDEKPEEPKTPEKVEEEKEETTEETATGDAILAAAISLGVASVILIAAIIYMKKSKK